MSVTILTYPEPLPDLEPVIPLREAALCIDCDSVVSNRALACPSCGSRVLVLIAPFVDGGR